LILAEVIIIKIIC